MDRDRFYYLFVNANCLAELALDVGEDDLAAMLEDAGSSSPGDRDEVIAAGFEGLDLDALDGMAFFGDDDEPATAEAPEIEAAPGMAGDTDESDFDIGRYMEKAYSYEDMLRERVNASYARADLAGLRALLGRLSGNLRPITERQTGEEMQQWLDLYKADDEAVSALVVSIRQLDNESGF